MHKNIPNILTYLRLAAVPLLVLFFLLNIENNRLICCTIFIIASVTDWFDGYLARRWQVESPFGAFLDPVADKVLVAAALILLSADIFYVYPQIYIILPAIIIISREILISGLREWMAEKGRREAVKVSSLGKYKTTFQMLAISCLLYGKKIYIIDLQSLGTVLLVISAGLTLLSMMNYFINAWPYMKK